MADSLDNLEKLLRLQSHGAAPDQVSFMLRGVRRQREAQKDLLQQNGFRIGWRDNLPGLASRQEFLCALKLIWQQKPSGWWLYQEEMIQSSICSQEAFQQAHEQIFGSPLENWMHKWFG